MLLKTALCNQTNPQTRDEPAKGTEPAPVSVLFVCTGNLSRSPLCQGIFEQKLKERNIRHLFDVDSAGTATAAGAQWGSPPFPGSVRYAKIKQINIAHQKSRRVTPEDIKFDYILAMEEDNVTSLRKDYNISEKVTKLRHFETPNKETAAMLEKIKKLNISHATVILDVPDPWGGNDILYEQTYKIMSDCLDNFLKFVLETRNLTVN
eukprot:Phypoly_transcript_11411.p1 GENE.Phypoly_transcript_11411~~Phypoly_transcript_11411.p1  ORF type:complete len:207 (+),score=21.56 Phypoly_transcript_11411:275-895(+)